MNIPNTQAALEATLRELLIEGIRARPFVCVGSPFNCDVAILGINPGTTTPFWNHWSTEKGFDRATWIAEYNANPANRRVRA